MRVKYVFHVLAKEHAPWYLNYSNQNQNLRVKFFSACLLQKTYTCSVAMSCKKYQENGLHAIK